MKVLNVLGKPFTALAGKCPSRRRTEDRHVARAPRGDDARRRAPLARPGRGERYRSGDFGNKLAEVIGLGLGLARMIAGARQKQLEAA
jgi:hypothetical protein